MTTLFRQLITNNLFYLYCSFNNWKPNRNLDPRLSIRPFTPKSPLVFDEHDMSSPSRTLCNFFWRNLPWDVIKEELGELHILDVGCGSGVYGDYLNEFSNGNIKTYTGLDIYEHPSWSISKSLDRQFRRFNGRSIALSIAEQTNFFMSQSAIEHFRNDLGYFKEIARFVLLHSRPTTQVHLFPSVACMKLYGRHGYRQYTPRTISRITRMFPDAQATLFGLGGPACNRVHETYITKPLARSGKDERKTKPDEYRHAVVSAIDNDHESQAILTDPSFWALVICSHWKKPIDFSL